MKKRVVPFAALAIVSSIALFAMALAAQEPPLDKLQHLSQVLNLSPGQKSQLLPILQAEGPKIKGVMHDPNLPPKEKEKQLHAVYDQTDPLVKNILNPTQYKMWSQIRKDELEKIKKGGF